MIGYLIGLFNPKGHEAIKAPFATNFKLYILAVDYEIERHSIHTPYYVRYSSVLDIVYVMH